MKKHAVWLWALESDISALDSATAAQTRNCLIPQPHYPIPFDATELEPDPQLSPLSFPTVYTDIPGKKKSSFTTSTTGLVNTVEAYHTSRAAMDFNHLDEQL